MLPRVHDRAVVRARSTGAGRAGARRRSSDSIGRALRSVTDLRAMGERMITIDCDVLQADAGTRTASITGGYVALALALRGLRTRACACAIRSPPCQRRDRRAARLGLDLCYEEDAGAEVDFNVVMTGAGALVEVQGTAEGAPFSRADLDAMLDLATAGIGELTEIQRSAARRRDAARPRSHSRPATRTSSASSRGSAPTGRSRGSRSTTTTRPTSRTSRRRARPTSRTPRSRRGRWRRRSGCRRWPTTPGIEVDALGGAPGAPERPVRGRAGHR